MKRLTFKVKLQKLENTISLIKEINKISCRINIDFEKGFVQVEDATEEFLNTIIDLVDNYFEILAVDIDNVLNSNKELVSETDTNSSEYLVANFEEEVSNSTDEDSTDALLGDVCNEIPEIESAEVVDDSVDDENNYTEDENVEKCSDDISIEETQNNPEETESNTTITQIALPQSEDDLIVKKVEFEEPHIEELMNKLAKTMYWLVFQKKVQLNTLDRYLYSFLRELSMNFSHKEIVEVKIGDVVSCDFGQHLPGEINGNGVSAIVCNFLHDNMAYVVPITKYTDISSKSYLPVSVPYDINYENKFYVGGTALLDKGKYIRVERFNEVIGKTSPGFLIHLLTKLSTTFDFTKEFLARTMCKDDEDVSDTPVKDESDSIDEDVSTNPDDSAESDDSAEPAEENSSKTVVTEKKSSGIIEEAINEEFGVYLEELDKTKPAEEQIKTFLEVIEMPLNSKFIPKTFEIALNVKKINYENIILELKKIYPSIKEEIIKSSLKEDFKNWLKKYPELAKKCPKISIIAILKEFAKRFQ